MKKVLGLGIPTLANMFCETLDVMTNGEIGQYFDRYNISTIEKYVEKSEQKTAKLFETALEGALIIANLPHIGRKEHLIFAKNFGIAFQIRDDLINCLTSKTDINDGIYTAPVIYSNGIVITNIGIEKTKTLLNNYIDAAEQALNSIDESNYKTALIELLELYRDV